MTDFKGNGKQEMNKNAKFNKKFHKPANQAQQNSATQQEAIAIVPCLMFSNLPADGAKSKVMQMCSQYGQVTAVRYNPTMQRCFVDFARTIDMENALIGLEQNVYNIKVSKGQQKNKVSNNQNQDQTNIPHHNPFRNPPQGANAKEFSQKSSNDENKIQGVANWREQRESPNKEEKSFENQMQQKSSYKQQQQQMKPQFNQQKQPFNNQQRSPHQQQQQHQPFNQQQQQRSQQQQQQQQQQYGNQMQMKPPLQQPPYQPFNNQPQQHQQPQQQQQYGNHMRTPLQQQQNQPFNNQQHQRSPQQHQQQPQQHQQQPQQHQQQQHGNHMKPPFQQQQHQPFNNQQNQRPPQQQQQYGNQKSQTKNHLNQQQQQQQKFGNKMQGQNSGAANQKQKYQKPNPNQAEIIRNKRAQNEMAQPKEEGVKYLQEHQINITPGKSIKAPVNFTLPASKNLNEMTNLTKKCQLSKCVVCERSCSLTCAACGTFICSQECQIQIWQRHRLLCKKISYESANGQRLVEAKDTNLPYPELPSNGSTVRIMSVSKANVVFVRPTSTLEDAAFFDLLSKINFEGATLPALLQPPKVGQIVVSQLENSFHRAQVLDVTNQLKIRIIFLDFGELAEKPLFNLYEAPEDYMYIPRIVMPVLLKGVAELYTSLTMRVYLKAFTENLRFKLCYSAEDFQKQKSAYHVDLIDVATKKSFNDLMRRLCMPQDKEFKLKNLPLKTGKDVELLVMDNSRLAKGGYLYCCLRSLVLDIKEIQDNIASYMKTSKQIESEKPAVGKYCLVKNNEDGDWYRGKVLNLLDTNLYDVLLFDFGRQKSVAESDIFSYPEQLDGPIGTRLCQIKGFPQDCEESFVARLKALIREGMTIKCAEVEQQTDEKGEEFYLLNIDELLNAANETVLNIINM